MLFRLLFKVSQNYFRAAHWNILWGTKNGYSIGAKNPFWNHYFFKECNCQLLKINGCWSRNISYIWWNLFKTSLYPWLLTHNAVKATIYLQPQPCAGVLVEHDQTEIATFVLLCFFSFFSFSSLPNYITWCVTGVFPQSSFLDSEANGRCSLKAKEKETKLNPIRGMTEHSCGLMISPPHPCQNPGRAEWFESHRLPRWLLSATCVHHRPRRARVMLLWREPSFPWWMGR